MAAKLKKKICASFFFLHNGFSDVHADRNEHCDDVVSAGTELTE